MPLPPAVAPLPIEARRLAAALAKLLRLCGFCSCGVCSCTAPRSEAGVIAST